MGREAKFSYKTKSAALARAHGQCEAFGEWYGLPAGERCTNQLNRGVDFDHVILEFTSHDASLENCLAVCKPCHKHKTRTHDQPVAAETKRQERKIGNGFRHTDRPMDGSRGTRYRKRMDGRVELR